jgi:hypothetical protein
VARRADLAAVFQFLNFACIPAPLTIVADVQRLPPASLLRWRAGQGRVERWWRPAYAEDLDGDATTLAAGLRERLVAAVQRCRPAAGTRWGTFLSGGTDSSSITTVLARQVPGEDVHSFSIGFAEAGFDELEFARIAASACGAQGHFGSIDEAETLAVLPHLPELFDQPFGNASAVPTLACAAMAAADGRSILVAGDGGDEIFGGNERYAKDMIMQRWFELPNAVKTPLRRQPMVTATVPVRGRLTAAAVPRLRAATAVTTSTPWSIAKRAATWFAANRQATSSSSAKARGLGEAGCIGARVTAEAGGAGLAALRRTGARPGRRARRRARVPPAAQGHATGRRITLEKENPDAAHRAFAAPRPARKGAHPRGAGRRAGALWAVHRAGLPHADDRRRPRRPLSWQAPGRSDRWRGDDAGPPGHGLRATAAPHRRPSASGRTAPAASPPTTSRSCRA